MVALRRLSTPHLPAIVEMLSALKLHSWQIQLTVPMGRAADEPDILLQPYELLDLFPLLAKLRFDPELPTSLNLAKPTQACHPERSEGSQR